MSSSLSLSRVYGIIRATLLKVLSYSQAFFLPVLHKCMSCFGIPVFAGCRCDFYGIFMHSLRDFAARYDGQIVLAKCLINKLYEKVCATFPL